mgnify:CR=1 FL=1
MRLERRVIVRNLLATAALSAAPQALRVAPAYAEDGGFAVPTYSLKGLTDSITGKDAPRPSDQLGVIGRGTNLDLTGRLNSCGDKKGCISSFAQYDEESYVPPWTYQSGYSNKAISANDARRAALLKEAELEASSSGAPPPPPAKTRDEATAELTAVIEKFSGKIVGTGDRYLYAEFEEGGVIDDVEFLFSLDTPLVGYRSAARRGGDDKRQRNRIRDMRKALSEKGGWKSMGRAVTE